MKLRLTIVALLAAALQAQAGLSVETPPAAAGYVPQAPPPGEPLPEIEEEAGGDEADNLEEIEAESSELEDLRTAEDRAVPAPGQRPLGLGLLGAGHPAFGRLRDALREGAPGSRPADPVVALLPELPGVDAAALRARYDIPVEINDEVLDYIRFFQGAGRKWFVKWLGRSRRYIPLMQDILQQEGMPVDTVYLAMIESGFSNYAYSRARASGPWQFIAGTGGRYGLRSDFWRDERRDYIKATVGAARYLKALYAEFGHWYLAWAGYNAGEGKIRKAFAADGTRDFWTMVRAGRTLRMETKHYVPKLIAAAVIAKHPAAFGFTDVDYLDPLQWDEGWVPDATDLGVIARSAGAPVDLIKELNPELRRWCTPPGRYQLRLPKGSRERFELAYARVPASERITFRHHRVLRGDTLGSIARAYGAPVEAIMRFNGIRNARRMRAGVELVIPLPMLGANQIAAKGLAQLKAETAALPPPPPRGKKPMATAGLDAKGRPTYVVQAGDTLWGIAERFGCTVQDLCAWNGLQARRRVKIYPGDELVVGRKQLAEAAGSGGGL